MNKFYYTFGTDEGFPFKAGWIIMYANTRQEANMKFRTLFPDRHEGTLNCSFVYNEARWAEMDPEHTWTGWKCYGTYGAIPPYVRPQLKLETLTDGLMDTALERCGLNSAPAGVIREACYELLAHDSIFTDTLERVEKELTSDKDFLETGLSPEEMMRVVAKEVQNVINDEEIIAYRAKYVDPRMVKFELDGYGIPTSTEKNVMTANLIAAYAVIGDAIKDSCRDELDAAGLTTYTIKMITKDMMNLD